MNYLILIFAVAVIFYVVIPFSGAFWTRKQWREFRKKLIFSAKAPPVDSHKFSPDSQYCGIFKFFGTMEAIQGKYELWLRNENLTVSADMENVKIYVIPALTDDENSDKFYEQNREVITDEMPQILKWEQFYSLPQETHIMICGAVFNEKHKIVFRKTKESDITFLIYDGKKESLLRRGIWTGRHKNEYWNIFTPVSLVAGSFSLFLIAYYLFPFTQLHDISAISLDLSLIPIMPLFPPCVAMFFLYRYFWKKARYLRAERDLIELPFSFFNADEDWEAKDIFCTDLWESSKYCCKKIKNADEVLKICLTRKVKIRNTSIMKKNILDESISAESAKPMSNQSENLQTASSSAKNNICCCYFFPQEKESSLVSGEPSESVLADSTSAVEKSENASLLEEIIIEGEKKFISEKCKKLSTFYEAIAISVFSAGLVINFAVVYLIINLVK